MKFICALLLTLLCIQTVNAQPIIKRDPEDIWAIQWSPDASKLAVGYYNGHFQVFDTSDMSLIFEDTNLNIPVRWFGWSPSGTRLAVGYVEESIDIWDIINGVKELSIFVGRTGAGSFTWTNDENYLFVGTGDIDRATLRKYDMSNGNLVDSIYSGVFVDLVFIDGGNQAVGLDYSFIIFVNPDNLTHEFLPIDNPSQPLPPGRATTISLHPSQEFIAIGHANYQVTIWDLETRQITTTLDAGMHFNDIYGVIDLAFNATGTRLFAVTYEGTIRSWDTTTWQLIEQTDIDAMILSADFSPDGRYLAYGDLEQDSQIFIRDLCDFVAPDGASLENIFPQANHFNEEAQICLTENGQYDLTAPLPTITGDITIIGNGARITMMGEGQIFPVGESGNLTLKDVTLSGENATQEDEANNTGTLTSENVVTDEIFNISLSPDATKIFAYRDSTIDIINSNTLQIITSIPIDTQKTVNAIWSPDSNYIALAIEGGVIEIWDSNIGLLVATLSEHPQGSEISDIEWIDNTLYSMNLFGVLIIWDMVNYQPIQVLSIDGNDLALSPDGETLAIATFLNILLLDLNTMTITAFAEQPAQITSVVWSSDGQKIASSSMDGTISIWDLDNSNNPQSIWDVNTPNDTPWVTELHWNNGYLAVRQMYNDSVAILDDETGEKLDTILVENGRFIWSDNTGYYATFQNEPIQFYQYCDEITSSEDISHVAQAIMTGNLDSFGNTICLAPNGTYTLTAPLPTITGDITIIGNGARIMMMGEGQIFTVGESGNLTLKDVTLSGEDD